MDVFKPQLLLKRAVNIKAIVTPRWKEEVQQQLQAQINQIDGQLQQLDMQGQRAIAEIQKQSLQPLVRRPYNKLKISSSRSIKRKVNC